MHILKPVISFSFKLICEGVFSLSLSLPHSSGDAFGQSALLIVSVSLLTSCGIFIVFFFSLRFPAWIPHSHGSVSTRLNSTRLKVLRGYISAEKPET